MGKPIVLLELKGKRFSFDYAFQLLADLENGLQSRSPEALEECVERRPRTADAWAAP